METTVQYKEMDGFSRFMALARKQFCENRKAIVMRTLIFWGAWMGIGLIDGLLSSSGDPHGVIELYIGFGMITWIVVASMVFSSMKSKGGRLNTLMTPASNTDKYWVAFFNVFVGGFLLIAIAYPMIEIGRNIGSLIMFHEFAGFYWPQDELFSSSWSAFIRNAVIMSFILSTYFYGAIQWPRLSFLKTSGIWVALIFVFAMLLGGAVSYMITHGYEVEWLVSYTVRFWIIIGAVFAGTVFFCWLTYYTFKKQYVIGR